MARTTEEVDLIVRAITEGFQNVINDMDDVGDSVEDSGDSADFAGQRYTELASKLGLVKEAFGGVQKVAELTIDTIKRGAEVEQTAATFDNLAASIGETGDALRNDLKQATSGMVSDFELMQSANRFLAMGLAETSDEVSELSKVAVQLGGAMGVGPAQAMEDFALLLANQSIPRLDTFGISSGKVRERIAELTTGINAVDKETAFMIATMEQAEITLGKVGDTSDSTAASIAKLEASSANLKDRFAVAFSTRWAPIIGGISDVVDTLDQKQQKLNEAVEAGIVTQEEADIMYNRMLLTFSDWGGEANAVIDELDTLNETQAKLTEEAETADQVLSNYISTTAEAVTRAENYTYALEAQANAEQASADNAQRLAEETAAVGEVFGGLVGTVNTTAGIIEAGYGAAAQAAEDSAARQLEADAELAQQLRQSALDVAEARLMTQGGDAMGNLEAMLTLQTSMGTITEEEAAIRLTQAENTLQVQEVTQGLMDVYLGDGVLAREEAERLEEVITRIEDGATLTTEGFIALGSEGIAASTIINEGMTTTEENILGVNSELDDTKNRLHGLTSETHVIKVKIETEGSWPTAPSGGGGDTTSDVMEDAGVS